MRLMCIEFVLFCVFFFSSIRRHTRCALVTGVQTCALPICAPGIARYIPPMQSSAPAIEVHGLTKMFDGIAAVDEIGRASCRERVCPVRVDLGGRRIIKKKKS